MRPVRNADVEGEMKRQERKYERQLEKWQGRLNLLSRDEKYKKLSVVAVFGTFFNLKIGNRIILPGGAPSRGGTQVLDYVDAFSPN